jgi:hypothetical protein
MSRVTVDLPADLVPLIRRAAGKAEVVPSKWIQRAIEAALRAEGLPVPKRKQPPKE